jgi:DNA-binding winged helix-turn-helix (wHTH) protein/Tol biopolymer transport system component
MRRFGLFELDLATGELRKNGVRVRLQEQPLRILEALIENPGKLVTREQLRDRLWPSDTFVDFERSLNAAIAKLRQTLGDSAEQPVYIETVARKGYRFVAPVADPDSNPGLVAPQPPASRTLRSRRTGVALGVALAVLATSAWILLRTTPAGEQQGIAFTVTAPDGAAPDASPYTPNMAISPDGRSLAFVALVEGVPTLWIRSLRDETSRRVPGSEGADSPFWSPDGKEIGFFTIGRQLMKVAAAGGSPTSLCAAGTPFGGAWTRDGLILFSRGGALEAIAASGGSPRPVLSLNQAGGEIGQAWPSILPDGRRFVYISINRDRTQHAIMVGSIDDPRGRMLFRNYSRAVFAPPDYLLFVRDGTLYAQRWDFKAAKSPEEPRAIVHETNASMFGRAAFNVSPSGALAYRTGVLARNKFVCYSRDGKLIRTIGPAGPYIQVALSPDEKTAAFHTARSMFELSARIWLMRLDSEVVSRPEFARSGNADPVWSPDSRQIAFAAFDVLGPAPADVLVWTVGEPSARVLLADGDANKPDAWSPDGKFVLVRKNNAAAFAMPPEPGSKLVGVGDTKTPKGHMKLSPDGRLVAYNSVFKGWSEVYVARFPGMKDTVQVAAAGGVQPIWTRAGNELIYAAADNQFMAVEIKLGATVEASTPRPLFRPAAVFHPQLTQYAVSRDGQRFYVLEPSDPSRDAWHIVTRWQELVRE